MKTTNVYFIKAGEAIKIGIAQNVNRRLQYIQVGNPKKLEVLHCFATSEEEAASIESKLHSLFHRSHLNGEWYETSQDLLDLIQHIKEHGWESHTEWLENEYQNAYKESLTKIHEEIDKEINVGNKILLERLRDELGYMRKIIGDHLNLKEPNPMSPGMGKLMGRIKSWVENRRDPFKIGDIYSDFEIFDRKGRKHVSTILFRLISNDILERIPKPNKRNEYVFKKR